MALKIAYEPRGSSYWRQLRERLSERSQQRPTWWQELQTEREELNRLQRLREQKEKEKEQSWHPEEQKEKELSPKEKADTWKQLVRNREPNSRQWHATHPLPRVEWIELADTDPISVRIQNNAEKWRYPVCLVNYLKDR